MSQFRPNFHIFWASVPNPPLPTWAKFGVLEQTNGIGVPVKIRLDQFILLPCSDEKHQIFPFFRLRHFVVTSCRQSEKGE